MEILTIILLILANISIIIISYFYLKSKKHWINPAPRAALYSNARKNSLGDFFKFDDITLISDAEY